MIDTIKQLSKEHTKHLQSANLITIHENFSNHGDIIVLSFLLDTLIKGGNVTFLAIRENYGHYLSISKKMGKSIEEFVKNGKLKYYQCFGSYLCCELPVTQTSPPTYTRPPKYVNIIHAAQLQNIQLKQNSLFIIDALAFIQYIPSICYKLYEDGINSQCRMVFGGCSMNGAVASVLNREAELWIKLENDVGGYGKFRIYQQNCETSLLCKWNQGKFQLSKYMKM